MIIFSTLRYVGEAYGSASQAIFKKLEPTHNRGNDEIQNTPFDPSWIEKAPQYIRPQWINTINQQNDFKLCRIGRGASNERFCKETVCILKERYKHHTKIYLDGSKKKERVGYAVIWNHQKISKRVRPRNTIYSAEQSAIITAIHSTMK
jgi:hypothetical protein